MRKSSLRWGWFSRIEQGTAMASARTRRSVSQRYRLGASGKYECAPFLKMCPQICPHPLRMGWIGLGGYGQLRCGFQRRKKKVRKSLRSYGLVRGARGRNRTHRGNRTMRNFVRNHRACIFMFLLTHFSKSPRFQRLHFWESARAGRGKSGRFTSRSRVYSCFRFSAVLMSSSVIRSFNLPPP